MSSSPAKQRRVSVSRVIPSPPEEIFEVLASPAGHAAIDGSGTVKAAAAEGPARLHLGATFGMKMRMGLPYRITNTVVAFDEGQAIAWRHFGGHVWRFDLEVADGGTRVTETFDWSTARSPKGIELMGYPRKHPVAMAATLERLERHVTGKP